MHPAAKRLRLTSLADAAVPTAAAEANGEQAGSSAGKKAAEGGGGAAGGVPASAAAAAGRTEKRADYLVWDDYFMSVAFLSAMRSKDPSTQVGAW